MKHLLTNGASAIKGVIRKLLIGDNVFNGFAAITIHENIRMKVYLDTNGSLEDVSASHWLLCIDPIIYGIWKEKDDNNTVPAAGTKYHLYFSDPAFGNDDKTRRKKAEAVQTLTFFDRIESGNGYLLLLKLKKTHLRQLNFIKRYLIYHRYYKGPQFTYTRFKSFVAAYCYPRRVRVISFREGDYYNIFPMDLLGDVSQRRFFAFGLRHTNATLSRIIETRRIAVSEVSFEQKATIYQLGKHHGGGPPPLQSLPFDTVQSKNFSFYIPSWAERYKEITILKTTNMGSHMLLWGEVTGEEILSEPVCNLYLVHFMHFIHQKNNGTLYTRV